MSKAIIHASVPVEVHRKLVQLAKDERRSIAQQLCVMVERWDGLNVKSEQSAASPATPARGAPRKIGANGLPLPDPNRETLNYSATEKRWIYLDEFPPEEQPVWRRRKQDDIAILRLQEAWAVKSQEPVDDFDYRWEDESPEANARRNAHIQHTLSLPPLTDRPKPSDLAVYTDADGNHYNEAGRRVSADDARRAARLVEYERLKATGLDHYEIEAEMERTGWLTGRGTVPLEEVLPHA